MLKNVMDDMKRFLAMPERRDLEKMTSIYVAEGFSKTGRPFTRTSDWMISALTFLKWHYKTESAIEANVRAEKEGVFEAIMIAFKKECRLSKPKE